MSEKRAFQCPGCFTTSMLWVGEEVGVCGCGETPTCVDLREIDSLAKWVNVRSAELLEFQRNWEQLSTHEARNHARRCEGQREALSDVRHRLLVPPADPTQLPGQEEDPRHSACENDHAGPCSPETAGCALEASEDQEGEDDWPGLLIARDEDGAFEVAAAEGDDATASPYQQGGFTIRRYLPAPGGEKR